MRLLFVPALAFAGAGCVCAADHWTAEIYVGDAYNFSIKLHISQQGGYSQDVDARYRTEGSRHPLYYLARIGRWSGDTGWELAEIHHKLYLRNPPPGTTRLAVSHGFNIVPLTRAYRVGDWTWRLGAGPVITHAEAVINGVQYDGPYKLSGAAALVGGGRRFPVREHAFLSIEGMFTASYANPTLPGSPSAEIKVRNYALHGIVGIGYDF